MKICESPAPIVAITGADDTLPPIRFEFEDGNFCDVTVGMKRTPEAGEGQCRIYVLWAWLRPPSEDQLAQAQQKVRDFGFDDPSFITQTNSRETAEANAECWLSHGRTPQ